MADKDEFKFDDDDTFPETDLSGAFAEGEQTAPQEPEYPMTIKKAGGSKTKLLLLVLLLAVAGGGAYYFFMMEEPAPPKPAAGKVVVAPKPAPAPPKPATPPPAAAPAAPAAPPAAVAVAPPPKPAAPTATPAPAPAPAPAKPATVAVPPPPPAAAPAAAKPAVAVAPPPAKPAPAPVAAPAPAPAAAAKPAPAPAPAPAAAAAKPAAVAAPAPAAKPVVSGGPWLVEAGTFLNAASLKDVEKKIRGLGYEPQVSTTQKVVRMTRLRLGSFTASEVKEALAYARGIAPEAFVLRSGDTYTVYAGTYTSAENIQKMTERLVSAGVQVEQEPLEMTRTLSLVRFGGFADQATAAEAAAKARKAGIVAEVVNRR